MLRHGVQLHDGRRIERRNLIEAREPRTRRTRTGIDDDDGRDQRARRAVGRMHLDPTLADESCVAEQDFDPGIGEAALAPVPEIRYDGAFTRDDRRQLDRHIAAADAEIGGALRQVRHTSTGDHRFGRRAPFVDTGAPNVTALDQYGSPPGPCECTGEWAAALPRPDYKSVDVQIGHWRCSVEGGECAPCNGETWRSRESRRRLSDPKAVIENATCFTGPSALGSADCGLPSGW